MSETDLRANGHANGHSNGFAGFGTKVASVPNGLNGPPKAPHLVVRGLYYEVDKTTTFRRFCGAQRQKLRVLDNVSFEVQAGEILAILATNAVEGTAILDVLANRYNRSRGKVKGDFILNGTHLTTTKLSELVAYVSQETSLCPDMTARQTLLFTTLVQKAAKRQFDTKKRTNALLEELGLNEVRHSSVSVLSEAERRRLLIAVTKLTRGARMCFLRAESRLRSAIVCLQVALMLDTDILLLDQPIKGMDIFDTFFLIEYLRQWALISGRCVIMTIQVITLRDTPTTALTQQLLSHTAGHVRDIHHAIARRVGVHRPHTVPRKTKGYVIVLFTHASPVSDVQESQRLLSRSGYAGQLVVGRDARVKSKVRNYLLSRRVITR